MKKERKGRISEELYILTIVFSTERELFTRQEGHNSRTNIYSAFHNYVVQINQSPNVRRTGSLSDRVFQSQGRYQYSFKYVTSILAGDTWHLVGSK